MKEFSGPIMWTISGIKLKSVGERGEGLRFKLRGALYFLFGNDNTFDV